jgi:hypothetical protein
VNKKRKEKDSERAEKRRRKLDRRRARRAKADLQNRPSADRSGGV